MFPRQFGLVIISGALLFLTVATHAWAKGEVDQATRYLERSASLNGPVGWINIPSAAIPGNGEMSAGIHLSRAKINVGIFGLIETGLFFEADQLGKKFEPHQNLSTWELAEDNFTAFVRDAFRGHAKVKVLDQDWGLVGLAGGIEEQDYYVVIQRFMPELSRVTFLAGWGTGRFEKGFFGLAKSVFSGAEVMFEYDGIGINIGLRLLLAPNLIMSMAGSNLDTVGEVQNLGEVISDHLIFGITYVEPLW
jgi:hypothetical protein